MNLPRGLASSRSAAFFCGVLVSILALDRSAPAQLITEFMAENHRTLHDDDGDTPDWIEIQNSSSQPLNLGQWFLTDTATNLTKWQFPATNLASGAYLVVFASGKDRHVSGQPLHTNFKLDAAGEYLALVAPDGTNAVSAFEPSFPPQLPDISFGLSQLAGLLPLISDTSPARVLIPTSNQLGLNWVAPEFDDSSWRAGPNGVGFETSPADYAQLIRTDVRSEMATATSCYVRIPFVVTNPGDLSDWRLLMRYDDGFIAYLNGQEIARRNAPDTPAWDSVATANHPDADAVVPEEFSLTPVEDLIVKGTNVLAIHGLNVSSSSSDFLVLAEIQARPRTTRGAQAVYFTVPTPGAANIGGVASPGPAIRDVAVGPLTPTAGQPLAVTAQVLPTFQPVSLVQLHYRVMFDAEVTTPMFDDGAHQDGAAGDNVFGAVLPANLATTGQMVRYYISASDNAGHSSRLPLFSDPLNSAQYFGTVILDPSIQSRLPVLHWFIENPAGAESRTGSRSSVWFDGEFYDNTLFSLRGQTTSGFPKTGYNIDFTSDHHFRYATNQSRVKDIKVLTNYGDKSRVHNTLAYEFIHAAGSVGHFAFPVRIQRNGAFHAILDMMEDGDDRWMTRVGRDPNGALYKMYNALDSAGGSEKKTRKNEGSADLQALVDNLNESHPLADRVRYAYDNLDLPQVISYFTGLALISSQDHGHKNFYLYRDSEGSGEWAIFPWDVDLSWGRNWIDSGGYLTDTLYTNNVLNFYNSAQQGKPANRLYDLIFNHPAFRGMYLRRLRTVMDTILQAPGTPASDLRIEARIRQLLDQLDPPDIANSDADMDYAKWGSWGNRNTTRPEAQRILDVHLPGRREFLFNSPSAVLKGESIPTAQPTNATIQFGGLDFNPASGRQDDEYIEIINPNPYALDVSSWKVQGGIEHEFKAGTVIPPGAHFFLSPNVTAFRARTTGPGGGQNLYVQGNYHGQLSARGETLSILDTAGRVVVSTNYPGNPTLAQQALEITEIMFHPAAPPAGTSFSAEDFEFVELKNTSGTVLPLAGIRFTRGILFDFTGSAITQLAPGGFALVVRNAAAFTARYGTGLPVAGTYLGALENKGETLRLEDNVGEVVFEFDYSPAWAPAADGAGYSLERSSGPPASPSSWTASAGLGGTPGSQGPSALAIHSAALEAGQLVLSFSAEGGVSYGIYHRANLFAAKWDRIADVPARPNSGENRVPVALPADGQAHFYRLGSP